MIKPLQSITLKNDSGEDTTYVVASAPAIVETTEPASVASFSDGAEGIPVSSLIADINPVQNLNGQSAPYPAGGGDNKFNIADCTARVAAFGLSHAIDGEYVRFYGTCSSGGTHGWKFVDVGSAMQTIGSTLSYKAFIVSGTPSITINSITYNSDNTLSINVGGLVTNQAYDFKIGVFGYTGTAPAAWTPYANICPITGWTGMNVVRTGKNLIDTEAMVAGILNTSGVVDVQGVTIGAKTKTSITWTSSSTWRGVTSDYISVTAGEHYYLSLTETISYVIYAWYDANKTFISRATYNGSSMQSVTAPNNAAFVRYTLQQSTAGTFTYHNIQLEHGSSATTFAPYNGTTYPISWADEAGTVYGGTLDVTTGLLTVDRVSVVVSSLVLAYNAPSTGHAYFYGTIADKVRPAINDTEHPLMCSMLPYGGAKYATNFTDLAVFQSANANIYIVDDSCANKAAYEAKYNNAQIVYYLATPQTYQLTPQAVMTILGQNNIWADTGDVETAYCADTKLYIDKVIAAL